jgi:hypothetical protein
LTFLMRGLNKRCHLYCRRRQKAPATFLPRRAALRFVAPYDIKKEIHDWFNATAMA